MTNRLLMMALIALIATPLCAQEPPAPKPATPAQEAEDEAPEPQVPLAPGLAGAYLAARQASIESDFVRAADYYETALDKDGSDPFLQDAALISLISAGKMDRAVALAARTAKADQATVLAGLIGQAAAAKAGDWDAVLAMTAPGEGAEGGADNDAHLLGGMIRAWALLGAGKAGDSIDLFKSLSRLPGAREVVDYHLALARAQTGDYESAEKLLVADVRQGHILGIIARAEALSQLERNADAVAMLNDLPNLNEEPQLGALKSRLEAGETLPFDVISGPQDGIAQVLMTFAAALASGAEEPDPLALVQARIAKYLSPGLGDARLLSAQLLQAAGQFDLAEEEFGKLRELGEMRPVAQLARIDALARAGHMAQAEAAAREVTKTRPDLAQGWIALGDLLRQQEKFADSVPAYDAALDLLKDAPAQARWFALYARGIALERSGQFDRAEADLRAALELQPNSAPVLNYLGYSLVDRGVKLDEALDLIKRAVELSPRDGYILDSLAWAYFRLGDYDKAVAPMEKAVSSMASDSLINDHMGDIYWMVGRKREARIQWQRALSFEPETEAEAARIRTKLDKGLDAVLATEKAEGGKPAPMPSPQPAE